MIKKVIYLSLFMSYMTVAQACCYTETSECDNYINLKSFKLTQDINKATIELQSSMQKYNALIEVSTQRALEELEQSKKELDSLKSRYYLLESLLFKLRKIKELQKVNIQRGVAK